MNPKEIRRALQLSQDRVAVQAGVSSPTLRMYEANRMAIADERKRAALDRTYEALAKELGATDQPQNAA